MKTPGLAISMSAAIVVLGSLRCAEAESIVVVYDSGDPAQYVSFLRTVYGDGIGIAAVEGRYKDSGIDEYRRGELRDANLVVVLRDTQSGKYADNAEFWSTLATPLLLHSPYLARRGKWNWLDDDQMPKSHAAEHAHAYDPGHRFYQGVTIAEGHVRIYKGGKDVDINPTSDVGNGTLVASDYKEQHRPVIVTWDTSAEYHSGTDYVPGADRVLFSTATASEFFDSESGATDDGKRVLRNSLVSLYAGPTIARYTFDDEHFIADEQFLPEFSAEDVTASNLTDDLFEPGSNGGMLLGSIDRNYPDRPVLRAVPTSVSGEVEAVAAGAFFEFKVSLEAGCKLSLHNLTFDVSKGGESGPRAWFLRTSLDDFAETISSSVVSNYSDSNMESFSVNLTGSGYQNLDGDVVFRMCMYTNGTGKSLEFDNLVLLGSVVKPTPEPGTLALAMICVGLIAVYLTRFDRPSRRSPHKCA